MNTLRKGRYSARESLLALVFLAPMFVVMGVFAYAPFLRLLQSGLYVRSDQGRTVRYAGLSQYWEVLSGPEFRSGVWHSAQFVLYSVPAALVLGVLLAVAADRKLRGIKIFQLIFSSTIASSAAVSSVIFLFVINPVIGVFQVDWLRDPDLAMFGVALPNIWQNIGGTFVIVLAGLQAVPEEVIEATRLDGYSPFRRLVRVILPLISPVLLFLVVVLTIGGLQAYAEVDILTHGGPAQATETLLYKITLLSNPATEGIGAVLSAGLFVLTGLVAFVQFRLLDRRVHYGN